MVIFHSKMLVYQRVINIRINQILTAQICSLNSIYIYIYPMKSHWTSDFFDPISIRENLRTCIWSGERLGKKATGLLVLRCLGLLPWKWGDFPYGPMEWRFSEENMGSWWSTVKNDAVLSQQKLRQTHGTMFFCKFWCQHVIVIWVITIKRWFVWQGDYQWYQWYPKVFAGLATWHLVWLSHSACQNPLCHQTERWIFKRDQP